MKSVIFPLALIISVSITAQILEKEATVDLTKNAARTAAYNGFPNEVVVRDTDKQFDLVFVTKAKGKSVFRNRLVFDYDLNLINDFTEEIDVSSYNGDKVTVKSSAYTLPSNYRGEEFTKTLLTIEGLMANKIQKSEATYRYNWTNRAYDVEMNVIEDVKVKELVGKTIQNPYIGHYNDPYTGDLMYLTGTGDKFGTVKSYKVSRITPDLEASIAAEIPFDYVQRPFFGGTFVNTDGSYDYVYIFAAAGGKIYKPKDNCSPNVNEWNYIRLSSTGELKNRAVFQTKANNWQILGAIEKEGSVFVYGPGESKDVNKKHQDILSGIGTGKQDVFQILKVTGNTVDFVSGPLVDEINEKAVKPEGQKKMVEYDGKRVAFGNFNVAPNGDIFINAQDWTLDVTTTQPLYGNLFMFHFGSDGTFKKLYGIESLKENGGLKGRMDRNTDPRFYPDKGEVLSGSGGAMLWHMYTVKDISKYISKWTSFGVEYTQTTWIPRLTGAIAKFDPNQGKLNELTKLGNENFFLYSIPSVGTPAISIENGTKKIFIGYGSDRDTKNQIWLGKLDLTTTN